MLRSLSVFPSSTSISIRRAQSVAVAIGGVISSPPFVRYFNGTTNNTNNMPGTKSFGSAIVDKLSGPLIVAISSSPSPSPSSSSPSPSLVTRTEFDQNDKDTTKLKFYPSRPQATMISAISAYSARLWENAYMNEVEKHGISEEEDINRFSCGNDSKLQSQDNDALSELERWSTTDEDESSSICRNTTSKNVDSYSYSSVRSSSSSPSPSPSPIPEFPWASKLEEFLNDKNLGVDHRNYYLSDDDLFNFNSRTSQFSATLVKDRELQCRIDCIRNLLQSMHLTPKDISAHVHHQTSPVAQLPHPDMILNSKLGFPDKMNKISMAQQGCVGGSELIDVTSMAVKGMKKKASRTQPQSQSQSQFQIDNNRNTGNTGNTGIIRSRSSTHNNSNTNSNNNNGTIVIGSAHESFAQTLWDPTMKHYANLIGQLAQIHHQSSIKNTPVDTNAAKQLLKESRNLWLGLGLFGCLNQSFLMVDNLKTWQKMMTRKQKRIKLVKKFQVEMEHLDGNYHDAFVDNSFTFDDQIGINRNHRLLEFLAHDKLSIAGECSVAFKNTPDGPIGFIHRELPARVNLHLVPFITQFLEAHDLTIDNIKFCLVHPGSSRILQCVEDAFFSKRPEILRHSRNSLKMNGNCGSASLINIMQLFLEEENELKFGKTDHFDTSDGESDFRNTLSVESSDQITMNERLHPEIKNGDLGITIAVGPGGHSLSLQVNLLRCIIVRQ